MTGPQQPNRLTRLERRALTVWLVLWGLTGGLTVALASFSPILNGVLPGFGALYGLFTVLGPFTGYAGPLFGFEASALKPVVMVIALAFVPLFVVVFRWFAHVTVLAQTVFALFVAWAVLWFVIGVGYVVTTF